MKKEFSDKTGHILDRSRLPQNFPTHLNPPIFWEHLGRVIATYGFLEEVLGKAIFALTATKEYTNEDDLMKDFDVWRENLERTLTDSLYRLADEYGKAVRDNPAARIDNIDELVADIKGSRHFRNAFCHGSWRKMDEEGRCSLLFVDKKNGIFDYNISIDDLNGIQIHIAQLACDVIDTVTHMGWKFPGGAGPGRSIW